MAWGFMRISPGAWSLTPLELKAMGSSITAERKTKPYNAQVGSAKKMRSNLDPVADPATKCDGDSHPTSTIGRQIRSHRRRC